MRKRTFSLGTHQIMYKLFKTQSNYAAGVVRNLDFDDFSRKKVDICILLRYNIIEQAAVDDYAQKYYSLSKNREGS